MNTQNAPNREITMGAAEANVKALIFALPILLAFGIPYLIIWGKHVSISIYDVVGYQTLIILLFIIIGAGIHELIHGAVWAFFLKNGFKSIKFGIMWKYLTPYCHSAAPMKLKHYRLGAVMPGVILGVFPAIISLFNGDIGWFAFGVFFTLAAGGDLLMLWMLRNEDKNALVQDHPDKVGCILLT